MTAAELLLDLSERLAEANARLLDMAHEKRFHLDEHVRLTGKAEGIRLALSYVNELQRMTGADL